MEKLHKSTTAYVKSISKRNDTDDKEKVLPIAYLGQTMMNHGEDFEPDSGFGNCLISTYLHRYPLLTSANRHSAVMGRTNDKIARLQETYVANTSNGWLESMERSLAMMREYQVPVLDTTLISRLTSPDCSQEARKPPPGLRRLPL
jgi:hypothetical protein